REMTVRPWPQDSIPATAAGGQVQRLLGDVTRTLGAELALLCAVDPMGQPAITSAFGVSDGVAGARSRQTEVPRRGQRGEEGTGFVSRALTYERATLERLDATVD